MSGRATASCSACGRAARSRSRLRKLRDHHHGSFDGHKLGPITANLERLIGARRIHVDRVAPVIGHLKAEHRMERNHLKEREGDRSNDVLAAVGYGFGLLLSGLAELLRDLIRMFAETTPTPQIA